MVWDEPKRLADLDKHGLDFAALDLGFFLSAVVRPSHSRRLLALETHDGRPIAVLFRPLGQEAISIVSMRPARSDERRVIP
ncbi:BrnT family toxin [Methylobacterium dankookense]|uniref:BrnT family toxin n=1 Tax=Methylobacterium dankookense TaxID=560405 RepID=UPI00279539FB|nr:BrnT family toxin [Methylobacterium dankookense]